MRGAPVPGGRDRAPQGERSLSDGVHPSQTATSKGFPMSSTTDKIKGVANETAGKVRQATGDAMDDPEMEAKGAAQRAKGDLQQAKGEAKETVKKVVDGA